jgi:hypothetical protein
MRRETIQLVRQVIGVEGNAPLTVQGLVGML